jgi:hypothetical protein
VSCFNDGSRNLNRNVSCFDDGSRNPNQLRPASMMAVTIRVDSDCHHCGQSHVRRIPDKSGKNHCEIIKV